MRPSCRIYPAILLLLLSGRLPAQADEAPPLRVDVGYASAHVFRGVERAGASAQVAVEFSREGLRGGWWTSQPLDGSDPRELNLNAAYSWQVTEGLALAASVAHTWFGEVSGVDRSFEAGLVATLRPAGGFAPSLAYYRDFHFDADTAQLSFARSIALTKLGAFLELNVLTGWVRGGDWRPDASGPRLRDSYGYWGAEVHLPYRVGPHSTVIAGVHYADSFGRSEASGPFGRAARGKIWVTLGVNLDF